MTDFLERKRNEIQARLKELLPTIDEYKRLEAAADALEGIGGDRAQGRSPQDSRRRLRGSASTKPQAQRATKPSATTNAAPATRPARTRGPSGRAAQALTLVEAHPGITIPELSQKMGIKPSYLYNVLPALAEDDKVRKEGRGWHPVAANAAK